MGKYDKKYVKSKGDAIKDLSFLVGAKIVAVEPYPNFCGFYWTDEIGEITIELVDGSKMSLRATGRRHSDVDEDRYMEVDLVSDEYA